jgi:hypothetical protein
MDGHVLAQICTQALPDGEVPRVKFWPNTYEAPGCQETDFPYERISCFFPLGWARRNRHPVMCPGLSAVCEPRPHVSAPHMY